jgi:hypothetical protein
VLVVSGMLNMAALRLLYPCMQPCTHLTLHVLYEVVAICLQSIIHTDAQNPCCCHHQAAGQMCEHVHGGSRKAGSHQLLWN